MAAGDFNDAIAWATILYTEHRPKFIESPLMVIVMPVRSYVALFLFGLLGVAHSSTQNHLLAENSDETPLCVTLQHQIPTSQSASEKPSARYRIATREENWNPSQTAVIICDMWDAHHCYRAVKRQEQMVPRMEMLLTHLRSQGVTIIHAPSGCVNAYADDPARRRVALIPKSEVPEGINQWCRSIPSEENVTYPLDQSDGGEDDTPAEHAAWSAALEKQGRNPRAPWKKQHQGLTIDSAKDFISDRGDEIWNILKHKDLKNVVLLGVHTNMCVLGRPFGLRQLSKNGVNVALMSDLTDSMYNPKSWPHVSHLEGNALIISHIERHICPTLTSDQFLGGKPFRFAPITTDR